MSDKSENLMQLTVASVRRRAEERRRGPIRRISIEGSQYLRKPFEWSVAILWMDGTKTVVVIGFSETLQEAVAKALAKVHPEPDLSEYGCPPPVLA